MTPTEGSTPRVVVLVNPAASKVNARARAATRQALADHDVDYVETTERGHATELARKAAADGADAVVVLGGDGTINEAANGLLGSAAALGVLPGGSTNVFARTIGMSRHVDDAARQVATALVEGSRRRVPLGTVDDRAFLFHVGLGFDAAVVAQVERRGWLKRYVGQSIFVYAAFATWLRHFDRRRPHFSIEFDDGSVLDDGYFTICLNTNPYTYLGPRPLNVAPGATGEDGLSVVSLRTVGARALLGVTGRTLGSGRSVERHPKVDVHRPTRALTVVGHGPFPYQVDGDYLGEVDRLTLAHRDDGLDVVAPVP